MSSRIDVRELQRERGRQEVHHLRVEHAPIEVRGERIEFAAPSAVTVRLTNEGRMLWADVDAQVHGRLRCSRCLREIPWDLELHYAEEFVRDDRPDRAPDPDEGDVRVTAYQGHEIDVRAGLEEQILLALPLRAVCDRACRGLCPRCGRDLNQGDCGCDPREPDPRLAPLQDLLKAWRADEGPGGGA